jgi:hypothetical protein
MSWKYLVTDCVGLELSVYVILPSCNQPHSEKAEILMQVSDSSTTPLYPSANKTAEACSQGREVTRYRVYVVVAIAQKIRPCHYGITPSMPLQSTLHRFKRRERMVKAPHWLRNTTWLHLLLSHRIHVFEPAENTKKQTCFLLHEWQNWIWVARTQKHGSWENGTLSCAALEHFNISRLRLIYMDPWRKSWPLLENISINCQMSEHYRWLLTKTGFYILHC